MGYSIPLFALNYDQQEEQAVLEVLRSGWISMGPRTAELEKAFAEHVGCRYAIAVSNCTVALHLALAALEIGPGAEVIVPSLTFVATANAVGYVGATAIFAEVVGPENLCLDPEHVTRLITPRTRAIMAMHYGGFACDMVALEQIARAHGLYLIGDAAHAPATRIGARHVGTFGDLACFSFFANKNLACGEGGMVVTDRPELAEKIRLLRSHGMTSLSFDRARGHATEYDVVARGFNYRIDDIRSALALAQLKKLSSDLASRERLFDRYCDRLRSLVHLPARLDNIRSSHYIFPVVLKDGGPARRNSVRQILAAQGIQTSIHYPPAHRFSIYSKAKPDLPKTEWVADHELTLPFFAALSDTQQDRVIQALESSLRA